MQPKTIWIIIGIAVIVAILFAGLLPLPGQKDNTTPFTETTPSGKTSGQPGLR
jgi:hypothetical protein